MRVKELRWQSFWCRNHMQIDKSAEIASSAYEHSSNLSHSSIIV